MVGRMSTTVTLTSSVLRPVWSVTSLEGGDGAGRNAGLAALGVDDGVPDVAGQLADLGHDGGQQPGGSAHVFGGEVLHGSPDRLDLGQGCPEVGAGVLMGQVAGGYPYPL
jgi:hypothetical protein